MVHLGKYTSQKLIFLPIFIDFLGDDPFIFGAKNVRLLFVSGEGTSSGGHEV